MRKEHVMEPGDIYTLCGRYRNSGIYLQQYTWWEFDRDHIDTVRAKRDSTYWCLPCADAVERRIAAEDAAQEAMSRDKLVMQAPVKRRRQKRNTAPPRSLFQWASDSAKERKAEPVEPSA